MQAETHACCPHCDGCGRIANTADAEPWSAWESLPEASRAAVRLGLVQPLSCPACEGTGRTPPRDRPEGVAIADEERPSGEAGATGAPLPESLPLAPTAAETARSGHGATFNDPRRRHRKDRRHAHGGRRP